MAIFMIGSQRSGTNLLRLMLNQLAGLSAPHPPHIISRMSPLLSLYGDLSTTANFSTLVDDTCRLVELNPVEWDGVVLDRNRIISSCKERSIIAIAGAIYQAYCDAHGKKQWLCKSMQNTSFLPQIAAYHPQALYIYIYRDGRDVAVSFKKAVVGEKHFYHIAKTWRHVNLLALSHRKSLSSNNIISIRYEDLIAQPESIMQNLCDFLGEAYHPRMLRYHDSEEAQRTAKASDLWGNVVKPIISNNTRQFMTEASLEEIEIFESVAGDVLDELGYDRACLKKGDERQFTDKEIAFFDSENARTQQEVLRRIDQEDIKRRDLQTGLINQIRERHSNESEQGKAILS